jgi:anti-sigma factor RsiW
MTCAMNVDLAPYALGSLSLAERAEVQRHVADCRACRDELADLAGVLALLRRMPGDDDEWPGTDPENTVRPTPRAGRAWRVLAGAAASLVLLGAVLVGVRAWTDGGPSTTAAGVADTWSARDSSTRVAASADLRAQSWGTVVQLRLRDVPPGLTCRLVVRSVDGTRQSVGAWRTGYTDAIRLPAATAYPLADIAALDVVTSGGDRLVSLPAPARRSQQLR